MNNLFKNELFDHLKLVFVATLLLGSILINLMVSTGKPIYIVISVSVLIILYGIYIWRRGKTKYASEADPDTLYYLGFIFTLVTLIASFLPFLHEQSKLSVEKVLGIFGLGMTTTFIGLSGRIILSQFKADPVDRVDTSTERIASSIDTLTLKLDHFARDIEGSNNKFSTSYKDLARETINISTDFKDKMKNISSDTAESMKKITDNTIQTLKTTLHEFTESVKSINIPIDKIKESLNEPVTELAEAMKKTSKSIGTFDKKFSTASDSLDKIIENIIVLIEIYNKYIEKATGVLTGFETATKNINGLAEGLDKVSDTIKLLETFASTLLPMITTTTQCSEQLKQTINATTETITGLNDQINKSLSGSFDKTIEKYKDFDRELTEIYNKFIKRISDIFGGFEIDTKNINGLNEGLNKILDAIKLLEASSLPSTIKYIEQLKQTINTTTETITGFNSQVNNSLDLHKQYNESFTKLIRYVDELNLKRKQGFFNKIFGR